MRYILNDDGYLLQVSFGADIMCNGKGCTEYTGAVPAGCSSLIDWFEEEAEHLYRWKVEDGDLVEDPDAPEPEEADFSLFVKLWENPSPSKAFAGQTVVFNQEIHDFDFLMVEIGFSTSYYDRRTTAIIPAHTTGDTSALGVTSLAAGKVGGRSIDGISLNSITFANGYYDGSASNDYCIPQVIYGVRKTVAGGSVIVEGVGSGGGSGTAADAVLYDHAQSLSEAQKATARANIGAVSADEVEVDPIITEQEIGALLGMIK